MGRIGSFLVEFLLPALVAGHALVSASAAAEGETGAEKHALRYKFQAGEALRWRVTHQAKIKTTVSGTTQTAEMTSHSTKVWQVNDVSPDGAATFDHLVEDIQMRQKVSGRQELRYNSQTDDEPPPGFEHVARSVGVPISTITMSPEGKVLKRQEGQLPSAAQNQNGQVTIPLPESPVAVGESWSLPLSIEVPLPDGTVKKVKASQKFTLTEVDDGIATIRVATQILTPIHDPAVESQLIQRAWAGTARFDIESGRVVGQQMDIDKVVVGFRSQASSLHYVSRFTEDFLGEEARTAGRNPAAR
jgi:hypothetical protein